MTQADDTPRAKPRFAYRDPIAWVVFLVVLVGLFAADLWIKYESFKRVADYPVRIVMTEQEMIDSLAPQISGEQLIVFNRPEYIAQPIEGIVAVPHLLNLKLTMNTGAVFGLGKGARWLFVGVSLLAVVVVMFLFSRSLDRQRFLHVGLAMILAGALGNLYDRVVYAAVRDMFYMLPGTGLWPWIFNLADVVLLTGVGLVMLLTLLTKPLPAPPTAQ